MPTELLVDGRARESSSRDIASISNVFFQSLEVHGLDNHVISRSATQGVSLSTCELQVALSGESFLFPKH